MFQLASPLYFAFVPLLLLFSPFPPPCPFKGLLKKQQAQRPHLEYLFSVFNVHSWHFGVESEVVKCHVQHARMEHDTASNMCVLFMSVSGREIIYIQVAYLVAPCSPESFNTPPPPYSNSTTSKCWHTHTWPLSCICVYHHTGWLLHKGCLTAALLSHTNNVLVPFLSSLPHSHTLTICSILWMFLSLTLCLCAHHPSRWVHPRRSVCVCTLWPCHSYASQTGRRSLTGALSARDPGMRW